MIGTSCQLDLSSSVTSTLLCILYSNRIVLIMFTFRDTVLASLAAKPTEIYEVICVGLYTSFSNDPDSFDTSVRNHYQLHMCECLVLDE